MKSSIKLCYISDKRVAHLDNVPHSCDIRKLKETIAKMNGASTERIRIVCNGTVLKDTQTVGELADGDKEISIFVSGIQSVPTKPTEPAEPAKPLKEHQGLSMTHLLLTALSVGVVLLALRFKMTLMAVPIVLILATVLGIKNKHLLMECIKVFFVSILPTFSVGRFRETHSH